MAQYTLNLFSEATYDAAKTLILINEPTSTFPSARGFAISNICHPRTLILARSEAFVHYFSLSSSELEIEEKYLKRGLLVLERGLDVEKHLSNEINYYWAHLTDQDKEAAAELGLAYERILPPILNGKLKACKAAQLVAKLKESLQN